MTPVEIIDRFAATRVLVIGEAMLDRYVDGHVGRLCREAPVPIVATDTLRDVPGGAANTALGLAMLGADIALLSVIGQDEGGERLREMLEGEGVATAMVFATPGRATIVKQRVTGNGQLLLRLDSGSEGDVDALAERRMIDALPAAWAWADAVVVSDYGYGVATDAVVSAIATLQARDPHILVIDAKDLARWAVCRPTAVKPNYGETCALVGLVPECNGARIEQVLAVRSALAAKTGARIVAATLDTCGALIMEGGEDVYRTFTQPAPDAHAAGAGDVFTGALALALFGGAGAPMAADIAAAAATACVATPGTTVCTADELREQIAGERKMAGLCRVAIAVDAQRAAGKQIVFTNGCFDILHHGHISYLNRAKAMGDVLVVGLNSDASVRALKGPARPINREEDRAAVLAALSSVDYVVLFDEPTPARLIERLRPNLFVKGGDYTLETLPEASLVQRLGGQVKLLPFLDDRSTTGIIERIRAAYA